MADNSDEQIWHSVVATVSRECEEAAEAAFNSLDCLGTEISTLNAASAEKVFVSAYFDSPPDADAVRKSLIEHLSIYGHSDESLFGIETSVVEQTDWLSEWKKYWKPTVTERFVIAPVWEELDPSDRFEIRIEPNMAFGTGTHETTRLCIKAIEKHFKAGMSFLDVGTGTGILMVAAKHLSPSSEIVGCDIDEDSIRIARENLLLNGFQNPDVRLGSIEESWPKFDFVCANVTADVLIPMLPILLSKSGRILVMSGVLIEQEREMLEALEKLGILECEIERDGEWCSLVIAKN